MADEDSRQKTLNEETRETEVFPVVTPAPLLWQFLLGISINLYLAALCNPVIDYHPWPSEPLRSMLRNFIFLPLPQLLHLYFPWGISMKNSSPGFPMRNPHEDSHEDSTDEFRIENPTRILLVECPLEGS